MPMTCLYRPETGTISYDIEGMPVVSGIVTATPEELLPQPPAKVVRERPSGASGSGPYFKAVLHPYHREPATVLVNNYHILIDGSICKRLDRKDGCIEASGDRAIMIEMVWNPFSGCYTNVSLSGFWDHYYPENPEYGTQGHVYHYVSIGCSNGSNRKELGFGHRFEELTFDEMYRFFERLVDDAGYTIEYLWTHHVTSPFKTKHGFTVYSQSTWNWKQYYKGSVIGTSVKWEFDDELLRQHYGNFRLLMDTGITDGSIKNLVSQAYTDMAGALPEASANSIANILELTSSITKGIGAIGQSYRSISRYTAAVKGLGGKTSGMLKYIANRTIGFLTKDRKLPSLSKIDGLSKEAWLSWRYVYNTSKMDIEEYKSVTQRLIDLNTSLGERFALRGQAKGEHIRCQASCWQPVSRYSVDWNNYNQVMLSYGLKLNAVNVWDIIPYSFIVDWFFHVGDNLEKAEAYSAMRELVPPNEVWYSIVAYGTAESFIYYRWKGRSQPMQPVYLEHKVKGKTIGYRLADTYSIFVR